MRDYLPGNRDGIGKSSDWPDKQAEEPGPQQVESFHYDCSVNLIIPVHIIVMVWLVTAKIPQTRGDYSSGPQSNTANISDSGFLTGKHREGLYWPVPVIWQCQMLFFTNEIIS